MEVKVVSSEVTDRIITEQQLLDLYNISLDEWEIEKKVINTWEVGAKAPSGEMAVTPLFQVKVWLRSKKEIVELEQIRQDFIDELKRISPKVEPKVYEHIYQKPAYMLQINIFDLHFGKLAWAAETGHDYNIKIATQLFNNCIDQFIEDAKGYHIDKILLPIGNDLMNSDYSHPFNRTTKGTPQDSDTRWANMFSKCRQMLVENITKLSAIAPVDVVIVSGNHDKERSFYIGDSLMGWFSNNPNVHVDNGPSSRKYYKYHNILLGFTHGDEEKVSNLPLIMAQERPIEWGATKYREFHLGHLHHSKSANYNPAYEQQGVMIRHMPSLSATDSWHSERGYVGSKRSAEAYMWSQEKGLKTIFYYNL